jgi:hypothetical protein
MVGEGTDFLESSQLAVGSLQLLSYLLSITNCHPLLSPTPHPAPMVPLQQNK